MPIMFWKRVLALLPEGHTLTSLARDINVNPSTLTSAKIRNSFPSSDLGVKIAAALGVSVEYLITGKKFLQDDGDFVREKSQLYLAPGIGEVQKAEEEPVYAEAWYALPLYPDRYLGQDGDEWPGPSEDTPVILVTDHILRGHKFTDAGVLRARGDSMMGISIFNGDFVVFVRGVVEGDGLYAVAIHGDLYVKRLEWDPIAQVVRIVSINDSVTTSEIPFGSDVLKVVGKVTGWIHMNPY